MIDKSDPVNPVEFVVRVSSAPDVNWFADIINPLEVDAVDQLICCRKFKLSTTFPPFAPVNKLNGTRDPE